MSEVPVNRYSALNSSSVCWETLWYTKYHPHSHEDNLDFTPPSIQDAILEELKFFKSNGGQSVVEVTTFGKNLAALSQLSRDSGVNIVGNTGYYVQAAFPDSVTSLSVEKLYDTMQNELLVGVDGIKAGVIGEGHLHRIWAIVQCPISAGELGTSWPIYQFEKNVLLAAGSVQSHLKVPVIIHPGRNPEAPFEIMRIFTEAGGIASKTVMSHLDRL